MDGDALFDPPPLARPCSWDDVYAITKHRRDVPIELIERGRADWEYEFSSKDLRPCGRKGCEKRHKWGWVVALPGGGFTNVGHDCADKYANKDLWGEATRAYNAKINKVARDQAVSAGRDLAQQVIHFLDTSPRLAAAIKLHDSFRVHVRGPLLKDLENRAERGDGTLKVERHLSSDERELRRAMQEGNRPDGSPPVHVPTVELITVGELLGLRAFRDGMHPVELKARLVRLSFAVLTNQPADDDVTLRKALDQDREALATTWKRMEQSLDAIESFYSLRGLEALLKHPQMRIQRISGIRVENGEIAIEWRTLATVRSAA